MHVLCLSLQITITTTVQQLNTITKMSLKQDRKPSFPQVNDMVVQRPTQYPPNAKVSTGQLKKMALDGDEIEESEYLSCDFTPEFTIHMA